MLKEAHLAMGGNMRLIGIIFFVLCSLSSFATTYVSQVHDIDYGHALTDVPLVFLSNGQVVRAKIAQKDLLGVLEKGKIDQAWFRIKLDKDRFILSADITITPVPAEKEKSFILDTAPYTPSVIDSLETAKKLFLESPHNMKESQCYNRAHVWSYEWRKRHNLYTSKAWLFFSRKYIRQYKFEWWFHVAPVFHVIENGVVKERVVDPKYSKVPLKLKQWTDIFLRNDPVCPVVTQYSDQANYPESAWCYVMKSSMYYYQPIDLENLERQGISRDRWSVEEIKAAYLEAFDIAL